MKNIGRKINSPYCNNFFTTSNNYDLKGAIIIAEGEDFIVVKKVDCKSSYAHFNQDWKNSKQNFINDWCNEISEV